MNGATCIIDDGILSRNKLLILSSTETPLGERRNKESDISKIDNDTSTKISVCYFVANISDLQNIMKFGRVLTRNRNSIIFYLAVHQRGLIKIF
mmetsp:Transcript_23230/g.30745  ORF Transcript_23230/g.30745 Transcript_23230/m.30745 type:complete len:94 (-) Transcript_23230:5-286(-)